MLLKFNNTCSVSIGAGPTLASHSPNMSHNVFTGSFGPPYEFFFTLLLIMYLLGFAKQLFVPVNLVHSDSSMVDIH